MHGLAIFARSNLPIARQVDVEDPRESFMCFKLSLLWSTTFLFFLYRSPSSQNCSVIQSVSNNATHNSANVFVFGDFNINHEEWLEFSHDTNASGIETYNFALSQSFTQLPAFPTRIHDRSGQSPSLLDLFLTSSPDICKVSHSSPLGRTDHVFVSLEVALNSPPAQEMPIHLTLLNYDRW